MTSADINLLPLTSNSSIFSNMNKDPSSRSDFYRENLKRVQEIKQQIEKQSRMQEVSFNLTKPPKSDQVNVGLAPVLASVPAPAPPSSGSSFSMTGMDWLHASLNKTLTKKNSSNDKPKRSKKLAEQLQIKEQIESKLAEYMLPDSLHWLKKNHLFMPTGDGSETLTFLDGGCASVPDHLYHDFLEQVALHYQYGPGATKFSELYNPEKFRFFLDWDLKLSTNDDLGMDFIQPRVRVIQQVMADFFPQGYHKVVVSYARQLNKCEKTSEYKDGYYKHGLHMNWREVVIPEVHGKLLAQTIRDRLEYRLAAHSTDDLTLNTVSDQIDLSPYRIKAGALRMIYQSKMENCGHCPDKAAIARAPGGPIGPGPSPGAAPGVSPSPEELQRNRFLHKVCLECMSTGKIEVGRMYKPILAFNEDASVNHDILNKCQQDPLYALKMTSIRVPKICPIRRDFVEPSPEKMCIRPVQVDVKELQACHVEYSREPVCTSSFQVDPKVIHQDYWMQCKMAWTQGCNQSNQGSNPGSNQDSSSSSNSLMLSMANIPLFLHHLEIKEDTYANQSQACKRQKMLTKSLGSELANSGLLQDKDSEEVKDFFQTMNKQSTELKKIFLQENDEQELERFLRQLNPNWQHLHLARSFLYHKDGPKACIVLPAPGNQAARFCLNKNAFHTSSKIWFMITMRGQVYQRCNCRKEVVRVTGMRCNTSRISVGVLPDSLCQSLGFSIPGLISNQGLDPNSSNSFGNNIEFLSYSELPSHLTHDQKKAIGLEFSKKIKLWKSVPLNRALIKSRPLEYKAKLKNHRSWVLNMLLSSTNQPQPISNSSSRPASSTSSSSDAHIAASKDLDEEEGDDSDIDMPDRSGYSASVKGHKKIARKRARKIDMDSSDDEDPFEV